MIQGFSFPKSVFDTEKFIITVNRNRIRRIGLDINIELLQGFLRIQIENSYNGKTVFDREKRHQRLLTTKKASGLHGIGLENVRKMVEKYDGIMEVCPEGDMFRVVLILYMSEVKN